MNHPHVIMIAADQLRYDVLGKGYTPHIDSLSRESICFDNAYCTSPLCVPARGSLFTGLCPNSTGSLINPWEKEDAEHGLVKSGIDNLYDIMEKDGRECIHSGKQHLFTAGIKLEDRADTGTKWLTTEKTYKEFLKNNKKRMPGGPDFRSPVPEIRERRKTFSTTCSNARTGCYEEGETYYFDRYFTDELIKGLQNRDRTKALFVSAMFLAPHPPFDVPEPWFSKYSPDDFTVPENVGNWYPNQSPLQLYNVTGVLGGHYSRKEWVESWRVYLGLVSMLDDCVGKIIRELKSQGIYDDCLILFTSDHGEMLGSHRLFQKMCLYQEAVKVPLYWHLPGQRKGMAIQQNVSHIDVLPTICQLLDLHPSHTMEGSSLLKFFDNSSEESTRPVFIQYDGNSCLSSYQRCVVCGEYKLIVDVFKDEIFYELYHIISDPQETTNLLYENNYKELGKDLYSLIWEHLEMTGDTLRLDKKPMIFN